MNFSTAISTCLSKYATFQGRASRSEYWWFYLFTVLLGWGATMVGAVTMEDGGDMLSVLVGLAFALPTFAAGSRRLHDIGRSGWWQLLILTIIGVIVLIIWFATDSEKAANKYGEYVPPASA